MHALKPPYRIALAFDMAWGYYRGLLRGVMDYAKPGRPWVFRMYAPPHTLAFTRRDRWEPHAAIVPVHNLETARALRRWKRPAINVVHSVRAPSLPRVGVQDEAAGALAARHLLDRGFRYFGFAGNGSLYSSLRHAGFAAELKTHGLACAIAPVGGERERTRWLLELPRPAGVFCCTDGLCWNVAELCASLHIRVPEDLALLGMDNDEFQCALAHPPLSSVGNPARRIGFEAARMLDRLLHDGRPPAHPVLLPPLPVAARHSTDVLAMEDTDLTAAVRYINAHAERPLAVREILRAIPVSRRTLELKFRSVLGRSPLQEIQRVRIERARRLLLETDLQMPEVARRCGFGGAIQFSTTFKKVTGHPPSWVRKRLR